MIKLKRELKYIWKAPLFWLFIGVFLLTYTTEIIPKVKIYGPQGKYMNFQLEDESLRLKMAYNASELAYQQGYLLSSRYILGVYGGEETVSLKAEERNEYKKILNALENKELTSKEYMEELKRIHAEITASNFPWLTYQYASFLYSDLASSDMKQDYDIFKANSNEIMQNMRFSEYISVYFADIMGVSIALYTIFIIAFLYKRKNTDYLSYFLALALSIFLIMVSLASVTGIYTYLIAKGNNWSISFLDFLKYLLLWLPVTILYVVAVGMTLSLSIRRGYLVLLLYYLYFKISMSFDLKLSSYVLRWNYDLYPKYIEDLNSFSGSIYGNRLLYLVLSIILIMLIRKYFPKTDFKSD